jgi:hypothetical protein
MRKFILFIFALIHYLNVCAQTYSGQILDAKSKEHIPFVNIGIPSKHVGTVTDEQGNYTLTLDKELDKDTLQFSVVGYEKLLISIEDYKKDYEPVKALLLLKPKAYNLSEVVIKPTNRVIKIKGNKVTNSECTPILAQLDSSVTEIATKYNKAFPGKQIQAGTLIEIKKQETYLEKVQLQFCEPIQCDSITLRLNIYSNLKVESNMAVVQYENVLRSQLLFTIKKNTPSIEIDLSPYNIKVMDDFIVSFETLKPEDYKKISIPLEVSLRGEAFLISWDRTLFMKMPFFKMGCLVTISYEKKGNWFTNLFD